MLKAAIWSQEYQCLKQGEVTIKHRLKENCMRNHRELVQRCLHGTNMQLITVQVFNYYQVVHINVDFINFIEFLNN